MRGAAHRLPRYLANRLPPVRSLLAPSDGECKSVKEERTMIRLVVFLAIGVMGLILVRVRRQRKARAVMPAAE